VGICEAGHYIAPNGSRVDIREHLKRSKDGTILYSPENPPRVPANSDRTATSFEVNNESTFQAVRRLVNSNREHVACLNFASARNLGGGFLNGSLAQEEALACSSGLYPCLLTAPEYYEKSRWNKSALYLDMAIFSPYVPFIRDDDGKLLELPLLASVITAPAPNAGAVTQNEPQNAKLIETTLRRRADLVLSVAAAHGVRYLILGAWGCGVFRNDPGMVAAAFADLLCGSGKHAGIFAHVAFAVLDRSERLQTLQPFADRFATASR
jgi:uncharacterized protein (TIGR02452 family)